MANDLTGDYDVVAEFAIPAVDRVLAAMHSGNRFPHSWSLRVDDTPQSRRAIRTIVDVNGDAITDPVLVAQAPGFRRPTSASDPVLSTIDPLVNVSISREHRDARLVGDYSHLKGVAQLQLAAPTISLPDDSSTSIRLHTPFMARYFPDPNTMSLPDFLRGEIQITFGLNQVATQLASQGVSIIDFNLMRDRNLTIVFSPAWSPPPAPPHLDGSQKTAIEKAIRNSLLTSFQSSSSPLPDKVLLMQFKTLSGDLPALAVLMNMSDGVLVGEVLGGGIFGLPVGPPDPGSVDTVFLNDKDDFAFAVSGTYVKTPLVKAINNALPSSAQLSPPPRTYELKDFTGHVWASVTIATTVSLGGPTVELQDASPATLAAALLTGGADAAALAAAGQILLTMPGHVNVHFTPRPSYVPVPNDVDFDFAIRLALTLSLDGGKVGLQPLFGVSVDIITGGVADAIANPLKSKAENLFTDAWNSMKDQIQQQVSTMLSADNLQEFLKKIMNPTPKSGAQPQEERDPQLAYTSFQITPAGVILHGTLEVPAWPAVHVEFDLDPWTAGTATPEYSALKTWIPGGTIQEYTWRYQGNPQPLQISANTFVYPDAPPAGSGIGISHFPFETVGTVGGAPEPTSHLPLDLLIASRAGTSLCVTVKGTRVSASGPATPEPVSATRCEWSSFQIGMVRGVRELPDVALTRFAASGALEVAGHTSPWFPAGAVGNANLIVHFPDEQSAANLEFLTHALRESERTDTAAAILVVLPPEQLARIKPTDGLIFADDITTWERLFRVKYRPATIVVGRSGEVVWQHEGELGTPQLAAALKAHLVAGGGFRPRLLQLDVRIGQPTPNFLFEYAPGRELTLRKLAGRPVVLVFWKSTSQPSLETLRDLQKAFASAGSRGPVVLAINDGESPELAKKVAAEHGLSAIVVPDPERPISLTYGVNIWPTTIFLDRFGLVKDIRYGRFSSEQLKYTS